jgi:hypothetical protein
MFSVFILKIKIELVETKIKIFQGSNLESKKGFLALKNKDLIPFCFLALKRYS